MKEEVEWEIDNSWYPHFIDIVHLRCPKENKMVCCYLSIAENAYIPCLQDDIFTTTSICCGFCGKEIPKYIQFQMKLLAS